MEDTSGFYKLDGEELLFAANFVYHHDFTLSRENKDQETYPKDGWKWFESQEQAESELL